MYYNKEAHVNYNILHAKLKIVITKQNFLRSQMYNIKENGFPWIPSTSSHHTFTNDVKEN